MSNFDAVRARLPDPEDKSRLRIAREEFAHAQRVHRAAWARGDLSTALAARSRMAKYRQQVAKLLESPKWQR